MNKPILASLVILIIAVWIIYLPGISFFFAGDELWGVRTYRCESLSELFKNSFSRDIFYRHRPVYVLFWGVHIYFWDLNPFGYNLTGVVLHAITTLLVFVLLRICFKKVSFAFWASIFFGTHYLNYLWVYPQGQIDQQFLVLFYAASTVFLLIGEYNSQRAFLGCSLLCFALMLLSKEQAILTILTLPLWLIAYEDARGTRRTNLFRQYLLHIPRLKYYFLLLAVYLIYRLGYIGIARMPGDGFIYNFHPNPLDFIRHFPPYIVHILYKRDIINLVLFFVSALAIVIGMCYHAASRKHNKLFAIPLSVVLALSFAVFFTPLVIPALFQPPEITFIWHLSLSVFGLSILYATFIDTFLRMLSGNRSIQFSIAALVFILVVYNSLVFTENREDRWSEINTAILQYIISNNIEISGSSAVYIRGIETEGEFEGTNFRDLFKLYWGNGVDVDFLPSDSPQPPVDRTHDRVVIFEFKNNQLRLIQN